MSDGQLLYAVLLAIYLSECVYWCRTGSAVLRRWWRDWHATTGNPFLGNRSGRLVLLPPLPVPGAALAVHHSPLLLAPEGICEANPLTFPGAERPAYSGRFLAWNEVNTVATDGRQLLVNGATFCLLPSEAQARGAARRVEAIRQAKPTRRTKLLDEAFAAETGSEGVGERLRQAFRLARPLRWTGLALFIALYLLAPLAAWRWGTGIGVIAGAAAMLALTPAVVLLYRRAHRELHPDGNAERNMQTAKMILCPIAAIRAADALLIESLAAWQPLVVAFHLDFHFSPPRTARPMIHAMFRDLRHPMGAPWADPRTAQACDLLRQHLRSCLDVPDDPPSPDGSAAFCPRCHALFTDAAGTCPDCTGVRLQPFPAPTA